MDNRTRLEQAGLTRRQIEVAELVLTGISNKACAEILNITDKAVKFHLTSIYKKVGLKSRALLIAHYGHKA